MSSSTSLDISPLFAGLTKPPMVAGITLDYLCVSCLLAICSFIIMDSPLYLVIYVPLHVVGWVLCKIDPNIFSILMKRAEFAYSPNKAFWGCKSYEPF